jgi:hypothetical protein
MAAKEPVDVATTVSALLQVYGIEPDEEEFERMVRMYPAMRAGADKLFIPEARYEEPALVFTADWEE